MSELDKQFPSASMTQDQWEEYFAQERPENVEQLANLIAQLVEGPELGHDYNTSGISMSIAAQLAFNYVAREVGASGFQGSYAALHAYGKIMHVKGPFGIIKAEDYLYPQYGNPEDKVAEWYESWKPWFKEQAQKLLEEKDTASPHVIEHWQFLAED